MDRAEMEAVADIAYGIFEHYLFSQFHTRKTPLFQLVEEERTFQDEFNDIFHQFQTTYPDVAQRLVERFTSPGEMYNLIIDGEGVIPSKTTQTFWIIQDAPDTDPHATENERAGKWLLFLEPDQVDAVWIHIRNLTWQNELGISAKVSTAKKNPD